MTLKLRDKNEYSRSYLTEELSETERQAYDDFIADIKDRLNLSRHQQQQIIADFNAALIHYVNGGLSLQEGMKRLNPENLGSFYRQKSSNFYPLDNAAVVYPLGMKYGRMPMFRVSAYMKEMVVPEILQMALTFTIKRFPSFATTIKSGFFWHYLDSANMRYSIEQERVIPCIPINVAGLWAQSFRVLYYKKRISVELFHVLTDGTGAMVFLKTLVGEYLRLMGHDIPYEDDIWDINAEPSEEETSNEFAKAEIKKGVSGFMGHKALQLNGKISNIRPCRVLHLSMDSDKLKAAAKKNNVTITSYLLAQMFVACKKASEGHEGEIRIQVPINMRKYNGSKTIRNYAMYFDCDFMTQDIGKAEDLMEDIQKQIKEKASEEEMGKMMSTTIKLVTSLKYIPLAIKRPVAQIVYGFLGDQIFTTFLSNLGMIVTGEEMKEYVDCFDFVLGPSDLCRASCGLISYNGKTVLSITKITADSSFEEALCGCLEKDGINIDVTGSGLYAD